MRWRDAAALAASGLRGSRIRTLLTILGLGVGVGAVITVITLGSAGQVRVEDEIDRLGVDKIWIRAADGDHALGEDAARLLAAALDTPVCAGTASAGLVLSGDAAPAVQIAGYDASLAAVHKPSAVAGRLLLQEDHDHARAVCIVDEALAEALGGDVLGRRVMAGGRRLLVVGVVADMPVQSAAAGSGLLLMPLSTFRDTLGAAYVELTVAVPRGQRAEKMAEAALNVLGGDGYRADTLENEIDAAREVVRIFVMVLACVAAVCMLTGGIGVMNVLLVSVRERRREIGLIKALGGTSAQVLWLFLLEAAVYALLGGLLGTALGWGMITVFGAWIGLNAALEARVALPVIAMAAVLGAGFGAAPALQAAKLPPVEALRCE